MLKAGWTSECLMVLMAERLFLVGGVFVLLLLLLLFGEMGVVLFLSLFLVSLASFFGLDGKSG